MAYDGPEGEVVPYLMPLGEIAGEGVREEEIEEAEGIWSRWLLMEDWMLGSRAPGPDVLLRLLDFIVGLISVPVIHRVASSKVRVGSQAKCI